jgi:hypothetical protein
MFTSLYIPYAHTGVHWDAYCCAHTHTHLHCIQFCFVQSPVLLKFITSNLNLMRSLIMFIIVLIIVVKVARWFLFFYLFYKSSPTWSCICFSQNTWYTSVYHTILYFYAEISSFLNILVKLFPLQILATLNVYISLR